MAPTAPTTPLLSDPVLAAFLSPKFSAATYLNTTLPPLFPPPSLASPSIKKPFNSEPLSSLSSKTTTLLSTLDYQTQKLLTTLQSLTDEILRVAPRLGYEVDLLRGDVLSLGESLEGELAPAIRRFKISNDDDDDNEKETEDGVLQQENALAGGSEGGRGNDKPEVLGKLEMLSTVRARLEDVIRIFGHAMDWPLPVEPLQSSMLSLETPDNPYAMRRTPSPIRALEREGKKKRGQNPTEEILYLLASNDIEEAKLKVAELRKLATVFDGTVEGPARIAVVEALEGKVKGVEEKEERKRRFLEKQGNTRFEKEKATEKEEEKAEVAATWGAGYGLISHLSKMRGMGQG